MATLITKENYSVDNLTLGAIERSPVNVRQYNELVNDMNVGASFASTTTQTTAVINTAYNANLGTAVYSSGVTLAGNALSFTVAAAGTYSVDSSLQVFKNNTTTEGTITAWYAVNGTAQANTGNRVSLAISNQVAFMTLHTHLVLNAGDSVSLFYAANSTDMQLQAIAASAPYPAIASISLEVDKIR